MCEFDWIVVADELIKLSLLTNFWNNRIVSSSHQWNSLIIIIIMVQVHLLGLPKCEYCFKFSSTYVTCHKYKSPKSISTSKRSLWIQLNWNCSAISTVESAKSVKIFINKNRKFLFFPLQKYKWVQCWQNNLCRCDVIS